MDGCATCAQFALYTISLCPRGVEPETKPGRRLPGIGRICLDEGVLVMGDAPISRIEDDPACALKLRRQWKRLEAGRKRDRGRIGLNLDAVLRNADVAQALRLVGAQNLEPVD